MYGNAATAMVHRCKVWLKYLSGVEASSGVKIFHVTDLSRGQSEVLDAAGIQRRLVSYFLLKKGPQRPGEICRRAR